MSDIPYSDFLPKSILETSKVHSVDGEVDVYKPVYMHKLLLPSEDNIFIGRHLSFAELVFGGSSIVIRSYFFKNNDLTTTFKPIPVPNCANEILFSSDSRFCLLFKLELQANCTLIYISCIIFSHENGVYYEEYVLYEDVMILKYDNLFTGYSCSLLQNNQDVIVLTGDYQYGFKKAQHELCDQHLTVLRCEFSSDKVLLTQSFEHNLATIFGEHKLQIISDHNQVCLFAVPVKNSFVLYSVTRNCFGSLLELPGCRCYMTACKRYSNQFVMIDVEDELYVISSEGKSLELYVEKHFSLGDINLKNLHCPDAVMSCFDRAVVAIYNRYMVCLIDVELEIVIAKLLFRDYLHAKKVYIGWSAQEVFVISKALIPVMEVFYVKNKNISLKNLSRMVTMQTFPPSVLKKMNLPKSLKLYLKLS